MKYSKIIMKAYPFLENVIETERKNYTVRCLNSAYYPTDTAVFCEQLLSRMEQRKKLYDLKRKLDVLFSRLTDLEKDLILFKYAGKTPRTPFKFTERTYFRKQVKLIKKIEKFLSYLNVSDEQFERDFMGMTYFQVLFDEEIASKRKRSSVSVKKAFNIFTGSGDKKAARSA